MVSQRMRVGKFDFCVSVRALNHDTFVLLKRGTVHNLTTAMVAYLCQRVASMLLRDQPAGYLQETTNGEK